jgi:NitT/TauT family transport system substrate-binding protein
MTPHDRPAWYSTPGRQRSTVHKAGAYHRLSGTYPATSLYMQTSYVNAHKDTVQKLVTAYVATLKWIQSHTATQIADQLPPD